MTSIDRESLRTRLIAKAALYHELKRDAELDGRSEDAAYHDRQYQQALVGFQSLGGDSA